MKLLSSLLILMVVAGSCKTGEKTVTSQESSETMVKPGREAPKTKKDIVGDNYKTAVIYKSLSRASFEYIYISKDEVLYTKDRGLLKMETYKCLESEWSAINGLIEKTDLTLIQELKAPTDKRLYDGAPHATLEIIKGDMVFSTPSFDHGFPPEDVKALVNKVLSVQQRVIKP